MKKKSLPKASATNTTTSKAAPAVDKVVEPKATVSTVPAASPKKTKAAKAAKPPKLAAAPKSKESSDEKVVLLNIQLGSAESVFVAGTFNDWNPDRHPMKSNGDNIWTCELTLPAGTYEYLFVVDGDWICDPAACDQIPNPFGGMNCVLKV